MTSHNCEEFLTPLSIVTLVFENKGPITLVTKSLPLPHETVTSFNDDP
jgi:hypothetical protein